MVDIDTGESDTAVITVIYEILPVADDESSIGNTPGNVVSQDILVGDTDTDGTIDPSSVDLITPTSATNIITDLDGDIIGFTVPGEGVWLYDNNTGGLSFDPEIGFTGDPTAIQYTVDDNDGNTTNIATVIVEYLDIPPVANNNVSTGNDTGNPVSLDILANDTLADGSTPSPEDIIFDFVVPTGAADPIIGANGNTIGFTVPGEGVWSYDEISGEVTFTPEAGFTNDPTPIQYELTDIDTGETTVSPATITIGYGIEFPVSENDESLNNPTGTSVSVAILDNDNDPDGNLDQDSVNLTPSADAENIITDADGDIIGFDVPGEGTWIYDPSTGGLEFTPEPGFVIDPTPIIYTVDDNDGNPSNPSTVTIDYVDVADLSLTKIVVDNDIRPLVGSEITFEIRVFNDGPQDATGVTVTDLLPSGYDFVLYSSTSGSYNQTTGLWEIGTVLSGESETLLIDVLVNDTGEYLNIAEVTSSDVFDIDSFPNNDDGDQSEDDEDNAIVTPVDFATDLSLVKTVVDNDITPLVGSEITFQITVTNDGPQNTTGVTVTDLLPSGYDFVLFSSTSGAYDEITGVWNIGGIANGESETLLIDVLVNASGEYLNIAEVTSSDIVDIDSTPDNDDGDQSEDDEDNAIVTPVNITTDLSLVKTVVDNDITPLVGSEITFQITVTNDGPQDTTGVTVTDLLPSGYDFVLFSSTAGAYDEITGIWNIGGIANGESETLLIDVLVNASGEYLNIAEVTSSSVFDIDSTPDNDDGDQSEDDEDNAIVTPIGSIADLSLTKTVVDNDITPLVGSEITFQITISNDGPETATGVEVLELLPSGYDFLTFSSSTGTYNEVSGIWEVGNLENGDIETLLIDVQVKPNGDYLNIAEVSASNVLDSDSTPGNGITTEDDYAEASVEPTQIIADLSISKTTVSGRTIALPGDEIRFQITVTNDGPGIATNVVAQDLLPVGFEYVQHSATSGTYDPATGIWDAEDIPANGSQTIFIDVIVREPTDTPGEFINNAEIISSDQLDPDTSGNQVSYTIKVPISDLSLIKSVSNDMPNVGDTITFTITVNNEGPDLATGIDIVDVLPIGYGQPSNISGPPGLPLGSVNGNTIEWLNLQIPIGGIELTYDVVVNNPTLAEDEYKNIVQITGAAVFDPDATPNNDDGDQSEDDEAFFEIFTPGTDIEILKSVDNLNPIIAQEVVFTIQANNLGGLNATSVEVMDELPSGYEFISYITTSGVYDNGSGLWTIPSVSAGGTESLEITVKVLDINDYLNTASLISLDQIDINSDNDINQAEIDPACLTIYNEFSPNGNGVNEVFYIDCINNYPNNKLEIYNRWGNLVYDKNGYDNTFDGISNGRAVLNKNQRLPIGTYYYILDLGNGSEKKAGWLFIMR